MARTEAYSVLAQMSALAFMGIVSLAGCSALTPPTATSIAGLPPDGTVAMDETFVAGAAEGSGKLHYQGQTYPFILVGAVMGPGGGLSKIRAGGEVYKLNNVSDFPGRYTQGTGDVGLATSGAGDLWLRNGSGVIMHLKDTSTGAMLTLGRDEVFIRMKQ